MSADRACCAETEVFGHLQVLINMNRRTALLKLLFIKDKKCTPSIIDKYIYLQAGILTGHYNHFYLDTSQWVYGAKMSRVDVDAMYHVASTLIRRHFNMCVQG